MEQKSSIKISNFTIWETLKSLDDEVSTKYKVHKGLDDIYNSSTDEIKPLLLDTVESLLSRFDCIREKIQKDWDNRPAWIPEFGNIVGPEEQVKFSKYACKTAYPEVLFAHLYMHPTAPLIWNHVKPAVEIVFSK